MNDTSIDLTPDKTTRLRDLLEEQSRLVSSDLELNELMDRVVHSVQRLTDAQGAVVELVEGDEPPFK